MKTHTITALLLLSVIFSKGQTTDASKKRDTFWFGEDRTIGDTVWREVNIRRTYLWWAKDPHSPVGETWEHCTLVYYRKRFIRKESAMEYISK